MSLKLYDERLQDEVSSPTTGVRYVLLRTYSSAPVSRDFSSEGAQLVQPPDVGLPCYFGEWNPSGDANPPSWMLPITDGYAITFTSTGNVTVTVGTEQASYAVSLPQPPPDEEKFSVQVLQWDAAWLHTVFICELSYSGTSDEVWLRAGDVGTENIYACDIESDGTYEAWCEYVDGDALVHLSPTPSGTVVLRAVIMGDTR